LKAKKYLNLNDYELFVFDCDGVLIDSNKLKSISFQKSLEVYPENLVEDFIQYHIKNGGISRYVKLDYFFSQILKMKNYHSELELALKKFSIVSNHLIEERAKLIPGVNEFLKVLYEKNKKIYVCSGSDEQDLKKILSLKGISKFFHNIYGSPGTKSEIVKKILQQTSDKDQGIFFGDALSDYEAASNHHLDFIFVSFNSDWVEGKNISQKEGFRSISSFQDIKPV